MVLAYNLAIVWGSAALALAACLPLAIRIGPWVRGGAMTVVSVAALVSNALFGFALYAMLQVKAPAPVNSVYTYSDTYDVTWLDSMLVIGGVLLLAAWIMALREAVRAHQRDWHALLPLGALVALVATYGYFARGLPLSAATTVCLFHPSDGAFANYCGHFRPSAAILVAVVVGPVATLIYTLLRPVRDGRTLPGGLTASPPDAPNTQPEVG